MHIRTISPCRAVVGMLLGFSSFLSAQGPGGTLPPVTPRTRPPLIHTGIYQGVPVTYEVRDDGMAIYQGDIVLGKAADLELPLEQASSRVRERSVGVVYPSSLWTFEKVGGAYVVPYTVVTDNPNRAAAITAFNTIFAGLIQWMPRSAETDYVEFNFNASDTSKSCEANVGLNTTTPPNMIGGAVNCNEDTILHEMGHAIGLWHEMSRSDRNQFVTVNYQLSLIHI